ncbi:MULTISPECIES: hypothetical protein [unclassified Bradyrhizobium]|jgi:hypothetical protein
MPVELVFVVTYWGCYIVWPVLFGWAVMLCYTIIPGFALGWRLQLANASIRTYIWSAELLLVSLFASILIIESFFVGMRRFESMTAQPQGALLLLGFVHVIGLVPVRVSMWLGWRVATMLKGHANPA